MDGEIIAVDGTKIRASNNKKQNFSRKKPEERLTELDAADRQGPLETAPGERTKLLDRKEKYEGYLAQMNATGENEVSVTDPDAQLMGNNRGGVDVCYNVQSAVDGKHDLIVDSHVSQNPSDQNHLGYMVKRLKKQGFKRFITLADKGYYNGADLLRVKKYKIKAVVSRQHPANPTDQPEPFHSEQFQYDAKADTYTCPMGQTLYPHNKKSAARRNFYNKSACVVCPHRDNCAKGKTPYRTVTRSQYSAVYEEADRQFAENKELYRRRQQLVEYPFGTVKRALDGGYFCCAHGERCERKLRCSFWATI